MLTKLVSLILLLNGVLLSALSAQIGGNQLFQNDNTAYYQRQPVTLQSIYSTDSTLHIPVKVLLNQAAEQYQIVVSVGSNALTVQAANEQTNRKIEQIITNLRSLGMNEQDWYVDFISEIKRYNHRVEDKSITEFFDGFKVRKNLHIITEQIQDIDKIIDYCAAAEVHDIVKVDYVSADLSDIRETLLAEALEIVQRKKRNFTSNSNVTLAKTHRIANEVFQVYYPKNLYKKYDEANETSLVNFSYSNSYIREMMPKEKTFYYEGIETEIGVDKITDTISPQVGIQYVLEVMVVFEIEQ